MTFAMDIEKTLGLCCSSSEAFFPARFAVSYSRRAACFSRISASTARSPTRIRIAKTAARVDAGLGLVDDEVGGQRLREVGPRALLRREWGEHGAAGQHGDRCRATDQCSGHG